VGCLRRILRVLVGCVRGALGLLDAGLRPIVHVMNLAIIFCGFVVELASVLDDGRRLFFHIVLACTSRNAQHRQSCCSHCKTQTSLCHCFLSFPPSLATYTPPAGWILSSPQ